MDTIIEERNKNLNKQIDKKNLQDYLLNKNLSLRKKKLSNMIMNKRLQFVPSKTYEININELEAPENIKKDYITYLKSFNIKSLFNPLYSENLNDLKLSIFLLKNYIKLQNEEIEFENRILSRNDYDLIKRLCSLLNYKDKQIQYEILNIFILLKDFPKNIFNRLNDEYNITQINQFILNNDDKEFTSNCLYLLYYISYENDIEINFLLKNKIFDYLYKILNNEDFKENMINVILCICQNLCKNLLNDKSNENNLEKIIEIVHKITLYFQTHKFLIENDYYYYFYLLNKLTENTDKNVGVLLITEDFSKNYYNLFSKLSNDEIKILYIKVH